MINNWIRLNKKLLSQQLNRNFSAGPYNPHKYKHHLVAKNQIKKEEISQFIDMQFNAPQSAIRNVRHINPIRQSGPLPAYEGTYTMEDIRKVMSNITIGEDKCYCQMDVDEVMRRVPGITRKEVEFIVKLGLTPEEQVDYAYLVYNIGLDVFYFANQMFVARQVVTNSKGDKVEVMWNGQIYEDLALLNVGFAPIMENIDYHWEIFLWADPPLKAQNDIDLGAPFTWFEYEHEFWGDFQMQEDQMNLPEDMRQQVSPRNPHCTSKLWKSQEQLKKEKDMMSPDWYPKDTKHNIYSQQSFDQ